MQRRVLVAVFATLGLSAVAGELRATDKLSLRVTPNISSAPSNVTVQARIAKDPANRWLTIEADSGSFYRSSAIQLDGDNAPTVTEMRLSNLPSGEYAVSAILRTNLGQEIAVRRTVIVLSRFGEPNGQ